MRTSGASLANRWRSTDAPEVLQVNQATHVVVGKVLRAVFARLSWDTHGKQNNPEYPTSQEVRHTNAKNRFKMGLHQSSKLVVEWLSVRNL